MEVSIVFVCQRILFETLRGLQRAPIQKFSAMEQIELD